MKKGDRFEGTITKVDFPNLCRAETTEGEMVTVKNGIPGQRIYGFVQKKRSGRMGGRILEVKEKSPLETREPMCSQFPECGGCTYQTMAYEEQLKMKKEQVKKLLSQMLDELEEKNKTESEIKLSTAYGYAMSDETVLKQDFSEELKIKVVDINPRTIYRIADDRMYENKRKSKLGRQ